jgi:hypothetical protein
MFYIKYFMSWWLFANIGTEAKCVTHTYKLRPGLCDHKECNKFCVQQKYESGSCGFTADPDETLCYCVRCDNKTSVD